MSGVRYTLVESNTTDVPIATTAATFNRGMNIPGGAIDEIIMRYTLTGVTAGDIDADFPNLISSVSSLTVRRCLTSSLVTVPQPRTHLQLLVTC